MKKKNRQAMAGFGPALRFEVPDIAPVPVRGASESDLEQLKARLLGRLLIEAANPGSKVPLRRAANEAASLAWFTPFPLLFFPALLEEKVTAAQRQQARQRQIRRRTQGLLEKAAA